MICFWIILFSLVFTCELYQIIVDERKDHEMPVVGEIYWISYDAPEEFQGLYVTPLPEDPMSLEILSLGMNRCSKARVGGIIDMEEGSEKYLNLYEKGDSYAK